MTSLRGQQGWGPNRVWVFAILLGSCAGAQAGGFAGGTGQWDDPYRIATAEQLVSLGADPNLLDKHFVLVADIDLKAGLSGGKVFERAV
ncbi:MAG: hypothetical protein GTO53_07330, partial [Planctomycetales bacterium]|nr:hypothetical protein [Planctomycetales bacterium]